MPGDHPEGQPEPADPDSAGTDDPGPPIWSRQRQVDTPAAENDDDPGPPQDPGPPKFAGEE